MTGDKFTTKWWFLYLLFWNFMKANRILGIVSPFWLSIIDVAVMLPLFVLSVYWLKKDKASVFSWLVALLCLVMILVDIKRFFVELAI